MNRNIKYQTAVLAFVCAFLLKACNNNESLYLGQESPGLIPEAFAPGIVSTEYYEYSGTFTPDLKEFYFIRQGGKYEESTFVVLKNNKNKWQESVVSKWIGQPVISPDGKIMHLGKRYMERTNSGWSELKELKTPFNNIPIMRLSSSVNGTYYFDSYVKEKPDFPIRYSRLLNGKYESPRKLDKTINSGIKNLNHPFIAPDESYILWDAVKKDGYGSSDIYISFKKQDGSWGNAINLGDKINTVAWEASAFVSPDGKYLFFSRNIGSENYENVDIFWVDAQIIKNLKKQLK
ncbi:hypothetical protein [uncultured Draconibacterium sp.]|uniref:hypothetical protein n=1 Tax=uncultured Draconibacterium sp. TaxID=1573823 RepID=UPI002AA61C33|nr:hypothetical protein [uncultured Draconibacterium sp.]